jgi:hypothetical protein
MHRLALYIVLGLLNISAEAQTSRNDEYTAIIVRRAGAKTHREHNTWVARVVDRRGATRYQISKDIAFDTQFPAIYLTDDGASVVVRVFDGLVEFYDGAGNLVRTLEPFGRKTTEHEQTIKCNVAGNRAALLFSTPEANNATLLLTDVSGRELWRKNLKEKQAAEVFLSRNGKYVVAGSYTFGTRLRSFTQAFDEDGNEAGVFDDAFRCADISDGGRIVLSGKNSLSIHQLGQPKLKFVWKTERRDQIVTGVRIAGSDVACSVEHVVMKEGIPMYLNPSLVVLDATAKVRTSKQLRSSSTTPSTIRVTPHQVVLTSKSSSVFLPISTSK